MIFVLRAVQVESITRELSVDIANAFKSIGALEVDIYNKLAKQQRISISDSFSKPTDTPDTQSPNPHTRTSIRPPRTLVDQ